MCADRRECMPGNGQTLLPWRISRSVIASAGPAGDSPPPVRPVRPFRGLHVLATDQRQQHTFRFDGQLEETLEWPAGDGSRGASAWR